MNFSIEIFLGSITMTVGAFLRKVRTKRGLSIRELARSCGRDHKLLSRYERDEVDPSTKTLAELCQWYGCEPWEAVAGMSRAELLAALPVPPASPTEALVRELIARHGEEMVRALLDLAGKVESPEEFQATLRVFKAMRGEG